MITETLTSVLAVLTAIVVLVTAVVTYRTRSDVKEVHVLVNSRMTAVLAYIEQLKDALAGSDTAVPEATEYYGSEGFDPPDGTPV